MVSCTKILYLIHSTPSNTVFKTFTLLFPTIQYEFQGRILHPICTERSDKLYKNLCRFMLRNLSKHTLSSADVHLSSSSFFHKSHSKTRTIVSKYETIQVKARKLEYPDATNANKGRAKSRTGRPGIKLRTFLL